MTMELIAKALLQRMKHGAFLFWLCFVQGSCMANAAKAASRRRLGAVNHDEAFSLFI